MKAYKITLLVIDHDDVGDRIKSVIEGQRFPNHCISPRVMDIETADIGEWTDEHPLNYINKQEAEFQKLFGGKSEVK